MFPTPNHKVVALFWTNHSHCNALYFSYMYECYCKTVLHTPATKIYITHYNRFYEFPPCSVLQCLPFGAISCFTVSRYVLQCPPFHNVLFQLRVLARDGGTPAKSATATVEIEVQRNLNAPVFSRASLAVSLPEIAPAGSSVTTVSASDADAAVSIISSYPLIIPNGILCIF